MSGHALLPLCLPSHASHFPVAAHLLRDIMSHARSITGKGH